MPPSNQPPVQGPTPPQMPQQPQPQPPVQPGGYQQPPQQQPITPGPTNYGTPMAKGPKFNFGGKKLIIIIAGALILVIISVIALFGGGDPIPERVTDAILDMRETARVSEFMLKEAERANGETYYIASTALITTESNMNVLRDIISTLGIEVPEEKIIASENKENDEFILEADQGNSINDDFPRLLDELISNSNNSIIALYEVVQKEETRNSLDEIYASNITILRAIGSDNVPPETAEE